MTKKPAATVLEEVLSDSHQAVTARRLYKIGAHKVRITVKSDAYRSQCFARAEVWHPTELSWNQVHYIAPSNMATEEGLVYLPNATGKAFRHFERDITGLLNMTKEILA